MLDLRSSIFSSHKILEEFKWIYALTNFNRKTSWKLHFYEVFQLSEIRTGRCHQIDNWYNLLLQT